MEKIEIVFQDKEFLVVNKPHGISIHNKEDKVNLIDVISHQLHCQVLLPVHRLDKETSGLQIFAFTPTAAAKASSEFQSKRVKKIYEGIVAGIIKTPGSWRQDLSDKAEGQKNPQGNVGDRRPCLTHFWPLELNPYFSFCRFEIESGRQHQIRKHCAINGHALIGDDRYGNPKYNQKIAALYGFQRMALHCKTMELLGQSFEAPRPNEFKKLSF